MYKVNDIIDRIRFNTATQHDLIGKSSNNLFSNKNICSQLKFALDDYANYTKALRAIYSLPVDKNTATINEPKDILWSEGIRFLVWYINGYAYPLNYQDLNNTYGNFPTPVQGLPKWFNYFDDTITFYPQNSNGFNQTSLIGDILPTDTNICVKSTSSFKPKDGRITIGDEKIRYGYKDETTFYECVRGVEDTTPSDHFYLDCVLENNVWIYYHRLHFDIPVLPDDTIPQDILNKKILIRDEHVKIITDFASFNLLSKVDADRASYYKVNFVEWLKEAKRDILKERSKISKTTGIREPFQFETLAPYWGL